MQLPLSAGPEEIYEQEHYWTYAVFAGALLHDVGKMAANTILELSDGRLWNPHMGSPCGQAKTYRIRFQRHPYQLHTRIAPGFMWLLPQTARGWLAQQPRILCELTAWLYGDHYESGAIGDIVRECDGKSVAANLKVGGERSRFNNAPELPLIEKLMTALRYLLENQELKINGKDGASGWSTGEHTYLVCGTVADKVRSHLVRLGASEIPGDNTRLFDTWQEHGYALPSPDGGAIWRICIDGKIKLTVLKFETARLFHPSHRPKPFTGHIEVVDRTSNPVTDPDYPSSDANNHAPTSSQSETAVAEASKNKPQGAAATSGGMAASTETENDPFADNMEKQDRGGSQENQSGGGSTTLVGDGSTPDETTANDKNPTRRKIFSSGENGGQEGHANNALDTETSLLYKPKSKIPEHFELSDPKIARYFIYWLQEGLRERKIQVNNAKALVHVAKEGALIVTPIAFKKFIWEFKLESENTPLTKQVSRIQDRLRADMKKKKQHRRTKAGTNIHVYQVTGAQKTAKIKCWLLPLQTVFGDAPRPDPNPALENVSGFADD